MKKSLLLLVTLLASLTAWADQVTVNIVGSGTVDVTYNGTTTETNITSGWNMNLNGSLTLTMTPADGYTFQELQVVTNVGSSTASTTENNGVYTYTIPAVGFYTITYTVVFSQPGTTTYTLTGPEGMTFTVEGNTVISAEAGQRVDITLPAPGNHSDWSVSSSDVVIHKIDANHFFFTMPAKSVTVTAMLITRMAYSIDDQSTNGYVNVNGGSPNGQSYYVGDTITLAPEPNYGYEYVPGTLTAFCGEYIRLTDNGDGTWSFTMPESDVIVWAEFRQVQGVYVNGNNFPDENFRNWLLTQSYGEDGVLTNDEIAGITNIEIYYKNIHDLTGIEHFTALTQLTCIYNELITLDVSHNTALITLDCSNNQLDALDLSNNTALTSLDCSSNQLKALDVSHNTALTLLNCSGNQLKALDVSHNTALVYLECHENQINGENMEALVASLSTVDVDNNGGKGEFYVIDLDSETEQNVITTSQVTTARGKNWTVFCLKNYCWEEYDGSDAFEVSYIDENRETQSHEAIVLTGDETWLGMDEQESWYVAKDTLNYTQTLNIAGDVHLILANGAVMNIGTEADPISGYGIDGSEYYSDLTIYGQSLDDDTAGHLNINTDDDCIEINGDYAQHSGNVTLNSSDGCGVEPWYNFAFTGGTLYVTADKNAINLDDNVDILGGKLYAIGGYKGIYSYNGIVTFGWKSLDDEFTISSFSYASDNSDIRIVDGQAFTDGEYIYDSTTSKETFLALTNVTLRPYNPRYTFNSETGELALNWGEFNSGNKWGDDVPTGAVTSVTATDQVSFTGDCSNMFDGFSNCTSMDLSNVNTQYCTKMNNMFKNCSSLKTLDLSRWDTGRVANMSGMFSGCESLTSLNISGWNTSNINYMGDMFYGCSSLKTLDFSGWDTGNVANMRGMFQFCGSLETLNISGWNTSKVKFMGDMFSGCWSLKTLDLSSFKTTNLKQTSMMFYDCEILTTIYVGDGWSTEHIDSSSGMFLNCTNLVGGMGTTYDEDHTDAEYAHIDGGPDNPGYLTGLFSITLPESVEHGTLAASQGDKVLVNGDKVINGSTVTLTILPDNGYELDALTVTYTNEGEASGAPKRLRGGSVDVIPGTELNTFTFEMPAAPVTVNATFKETTVTGVEDINAAQPKSGQRYNMMGQPVGKDYKGIVIEDGKKIIVR